MIQIPFRKMHGLGNDFVVIDARLNPLPYTDDPLQWHAWVEGLANRREGVGCDQLIILHEAAEADIFMQIINADGSEVDACGNATRCVAWLVMQEKGKEAVTIRTNAGLLACERCGDDMVSVNMGHPRWQWQDIPVAHEMDTLAVAHGVVGLPAGVAVNMGNPHLVIFVEDVQAVPLKEVGSVLEHSPLFPERVNVTIAEVLAPDSLEIKTWERGAGETLACGTAACASLVAARRLGLAESIATVSLPGGNLVIEWEGDNADPHHPVIMTGAATLVFTGELVIEEYSAFFKK